jgi:DNA-binding HxlR family transcriptional regulator
MAPCQADRADEPAWFGTPGQEIDAEAPGLPAVEHLYRLIGSRWVVPVLRKLDGDPVRYRDLHRQLENVSHKVLTQTLRRLQRSGIVGRRSDHSGRPFVEYRLTDSGLDLVQNLERLERWARASGLRT